LRICNALLHIFRAFFRMCRALWRICRALLRIYRALLRVSRALLQMYRALLCFVLYVISCTISFRCKIRLCCRHITVLETAEICTLNRALLRKYTALLRKFMHIHSTGPQNRTGEGSFAEDMYIE